MSIEYKSEFFDLVNDLTTINKSIIFDREDDKVVVKRNNQNKTVAYILEAPSKYFEIEETIGLYDYVEFYRFLKTLDNPDIVKKDNKFILSKEGSKMKYLLSNIETMKTGPKKITYDDDKIDFQFDLDKESLYELFKMCNTIKPEEATVECCGESVTIKLIKNKEDNSFEKTFKAVNSSGYEGTINFNIFSQLFEFLPAKRDYIISVINPGYIRITLRDEIIDLNIYTARIKE